MCEPSHSIIQFKDPNDEDDQGGASAQGGYVASRLTAGLSKWAKKIKKWMHLSAMGSGHSETIGKRSNVSMWNYDSVLSLFEANWWDRSVRRDGGNSTSLQLDCAEEYAKLVSIGDTHQLRRFLEESMKSSDRSYLYSAQVRQLLLNDKGHQEFDKKAKKVFGVKHFFLDTMKKLPTKSLINFTLGFTRKRELLVPEWADDDKLWQPSKKLILE